MKFWSHRQERKKKCLSYVKKIAVFASGWLKFSGEIAEEFPVEFVFSDYRDLCA